MSEDCLSLNIWAPAHAHNAPVFFWIYGGALWGGTSRDPLYDGRELASVGRYLGYAAGHVDDMLEDYRRRTRRARAVVDRLFYEG